jgi:hypothetical protein
MIDGGVERRCFSRAEDACASQIARRFGQPGTQQFPPGLEKFWVNSPGIEMPGYFDGSCGTGRRLILSGAATPPDHLRIASHARRFRVSSIT